MTLALVTGADIREASVLANLAAGIEVSKRGTATVSPSELLSAIENYDSQS
jgi:D-beta-D-heptose 7-phosphate kinase/D-beta-D-heptose 1-phosphate adenosyltransferase